MTTTRHRPARGLPHVDAARADLARRNLIAHLAKLDAEFAAMSPAQRTMARVKTKALSVIKLFSRRPGA